MFFFFKQKTAYEMRISDWSSDVCSSDLLGAKAAGSPPGRRNGLVSLIPGPAASRNGRVRVDSASPAPDNGRPSAGVAQAGEPEPTVRHRGIAQSGSAPALGAGCQGFESLYPDHPPTTLSGPLSCALAPVAQPDRAPAF